jgi:hypothetical protein
VSPKSAPPRIGPAPQSMAKMLMIFKNAVRIV